MSWRSALLVPWLLLAAVSVRAQEPSIHLVPTGVITGPTDVVVEGIAAEYPLIFDGALIILKFDPSKVTISNPRVSTGWDGPTTNNDTTNGLYYAVTINLDGMLTTGPLLTLTVTPTGASADLSDCSVFQLLGGDPLTGTGSNLSAHDDILWEWYSYYPPGSCGQRGTGLSDDTDSTGDGTLDGGTVDSSDGDSGDGSDGPMESSGPTTDSSPDMAAAKRILRIAAGLQTQEHWDRGIVNPEQNDPY